MYRRSAQDLFVRVGGGSRSAADTAQLAIAWRAALAALVALGLVRRLGVWYVAADGALEEAAFPAAVDAFLTTEATTTVSVDLVSTVALPESQRFCRRAGAVQKAHSKEVAKLVRAYNKARSSARDRGCIILAVPRLQQQSRDFSNSGRLAAASAVCCSRYSLLQLASQIDLHSSHLGDASWSALHYRRRRSRSLVFAQSRHFFSPRHDDARALPRPSPFLFIPSLQAQAKLERKQAKMAVKAATRALGGRVRGSAKKKASGSAGPARFDIGKAAEAASQSGVPVRSVASPPPKREFPCSLTSHPRAAAFLWLFSCATSCVSLSSTMIVSPPSLFLRQLTALIFLDPPVSSRC